MSPFLGEVIGTMILIILGGGVVAGVVLKGTKSENGGWIVITAAWGLAVATAVYCVGQISGAHLNPAVTIGLALVGAFEWSQVAGYIVAQMLGAMIGATLVFLHYYPHFKATEDQGAKLAVFSTDPAIKHLPANFFSEVLGTFVLVLGILAIGANEFTEGLNPLIVGLLIVVIGLSLGGTTGYAINPARDLGPRIAHFLLPIPGKGSSNWSYAWIPIVGPIIGGGIGALTYAALFEGIVYSALWLFLAAFALVLLYASFIEKKHEAKGKDQPVAMAK
ncbi:aquaporin family protein [Halalkalibacterium halodurans]|uniref:Glycerol uptake facilitator n=2 Tax=Halalkalibacterium halodurans TaxID=86665 RepID=Q9KDW9_HALH5|nr:MIP/aquaporin family protein [Halalkalibacterium halodurans]MDY7221625.1 MIP/aquaporin family protein [Halalkalibacterium halodurans]MDY7240901.1 MIP/aquaporin family protein [Halalkalibacterium halodurans]MED3645474.1 aquaporin family protein [Halalkalibacterium halodurans]MED4079295.1 aquaporin family protein [Halalkalibacterium halodurans]MED4085366.1 aquaporin family protein [Halalkalibacterium halodurans]